MIVALLFFFFFSPKANPTPLFCLSALRPAVAYFAPKFQQYEGLGYASNLKSERETGTILILLSVGKTQTCLPLETNNTFDQIRAPSVCTPRPRREGAQRLQRLRFPGESIPAPAQGSLPTRAARVGDGRMNVRKFNSRTKPQPISSPGVGGFPTKLASSHCGHRNIRPAAAGSHRCCWKRRIASFRRGNPFNSNTAVWFCHALRSLILPCAREPWRRTNNAEKAEKRN